MSILHKIANKILLREGNNKQRAMDYVMNHGF